MYGIFTIKYQTDSQSHAKIECDLLSTVHTISVPFGRQCMQFEPGWPPVHAILTRPPVHAILTILAAVNAI
jgi:hypothetical protein